MATQPLDISSFALASQEILSDIDSVCVGTVKKALTHENMISLVQENSICVINHGNLFKFDRKNIFLKPITNN